MPNKSQVSSLESKVEAGGQITTRSEAEAAVGLVTAFHLQLTEAVTLQNLEVLAARRHDATIADLTAKIAAETVRLAAWAKSNRAEFEESQTLPMAQGSLVFQMSRPLLKLIDGWDDAKVLDALRKAGRKLKDYIRIKHEVNRSLILADSRPEVAKLDARQLKRIGFEIRREESFTVEPKIEEAPAK